MAVVTIYGANNNTDNRALWCTNATYATAHAAASATPVAGASIVIGQRWIEYTGFRIYRSIERFDTSPTNLPASAKISAARLGLYVLIAPYATGMDTLFALAGDTVSYPLVGTDYALIRNLYSAKGLVNFSSATPTLAYLWMNLLASGIAHINKGAGAYTKFTFRTGREIAQDPPSTTGTTADIEQIELSVGAVPGSCSCLEITYTTDLDVRTDAPTLITYVTATLNGTLISDNGAAADCSFEYGYDTAYGYTTTAESKTVGQTFLAAITGLAPGIVVHYRAKAVQGGTTVYGADMTFKTTVSGVIDLEPGNIAVVRERLHYVDAYRIEHYIDGVIVDND